MLKKCNAHKCKAEVPSSKLMCLKCWRRLKRSTQEKVEATWGAFVATQVTDLRGGDTERRAYIVARAEAYQESKGWV